jgi:WD40 repeat protein
MNSVDGNLLVTGSKDNTIAIWNPATGKLISRIENVKGGILAIRITPQGKTLVVATTAMSKGLRIFDVQTGEQLAALESANLQNLDLSPDGSLIATANLEKSLTVWNLFQYHEMYAIKGHTRHLNDVAFDPTGRYLASSSNDRTVIIWDLQNRKRVATINGEKAMRGLSYSPDGKYLATMNENGAVCMWDVSSLDVSGSAPQF